MAQLKVGAVLSGFKVLSKTPLPLVAGGATAYRMQHERVGSEWLHIDAPHDSNNAFAVALATPPDAADGVAHVLEHTALCGSERFPVRDPFFAMLKRSLNTYVNALTAPDFTMCVSPWFGRGHLARLTPACRVPVDAMLLCGAF